MKRYLYIITTVIIVGLIFWGIWFFISSKGSTINSSLNSSGSLPPVQSQTGPSVLVQNIPSPQDQTVAKDFLNEIPDGSETSLGGTVLAPPFALQIWGNSDRGGEALLQETSSSGWSLISLGGGEWSQIALMEEGVPLSNAQQLVAGLTSGNSISTSTSTVTIPLGSTLTIGTSQGSVTMNNFYKRAVYIAQEQQAIVIEQSSTYDIIYNIPDSSFIINIFSLPFAAMRQTAEASFLSSLNIGKQDACKISAYELVSGSATAQYAGQSFPLSFCGGPATL
jgi:hypothetical protein